MAEMPLILKRKSCQGQWSERGWIDELWKLTRPFGSFSFFFNHHHQHLLPFPLLLHRRRPQDLQASRLNPSFVPPSFIQSAYLHSTRCSLNFSPLLLPLVAFLVS